MAKGDDLFVEFVRTCSKGLQHAAYLLTGDRHKAEEATQAALTRTYAAWSSVRHKDAYAYTRKVLTNHVIDGWRRPIREYPTDAVPELPSRGDVAEDVTRQEWLLDALGRLTPRERQILVLRYFFDLPEAEVAAELEVSVGTVKSTSSRALTKLRISIDQGASLMCGGEGA
ncbi:SigE family RNA polymerase sigma factor [Lentzea sp. NPDC034063]|uniref:SigE family RNA polymerase sigma factor n=1 Tax=unclassified Lentzea TaxID=2643253 RepID=UPI0033C71681